MPVGIGTATVIGMATAGGTAAAGIYAAHAQTSAAKEGATLQAKSAADQLAYLKDESAKAQVAADKATALEKERYDAEWAEKMREYNNSESVKAPYRQFGNNALATLGSMIYGSGGGGSIGRIPPAPPAPVYQPPSAGAPPPVPAASGAPATTPVTPGPAGSGISPLSALTSSTGGTMAPSGSLADFTKPPTAASQAATPALTPGVTRLQPPTDQGRMTLGDMSEPMVLIQDPSGKLVRVPQRLAQMYQQRQSQQTAA